MAKIHMGMYKIITVFSVLLVALLACDDVGIFEAKSITIPKHVRKITARQYANKGLKQVTFEPGSMLQEIEEGAFEGNSISKVTFPDSLRRIGKNAFKGNKLEKVIIPDAVDEVGKGAFDNNKIKELVLGKRAPDVKDAFMQNPMKQVKVRSQKAANQALVFVYLYQRVELVVDKTLEKGEIKDITMQVKKVIERVEGLRVKSKNIEEGVNRNSEDIEVLKQEIKKLNDKLDEDVGGNTNNAGTEGVAKQPDGENVIRIEDIYIKESTRKNTYGIGDRITFLVRFSDTIEIPERFAPTLRLKGTLFDGEDNVATYQGHVNRTLYFNYVVKKHSVYPDSKILTTVNNPLHLNGLSLSHADGKKVDVSYNEKRYQTLDLDSPYITAISVVDDSPSPSKSYNTAVPMRIKVVFSEPVVKPDGELKLFLLVGGSKRTTATYVSGDRTSIFFFQYVAKPGDIGKIRFTKVLDYATKYRSVKDLAGNGIKDMGHAITLPEGYSVVDDGKTTIAGIRFLNDGPYTSTNNIIQIEVTFSKDVVVTGNPQLKLNIEGRGSRRKDARYSSSSSNKVIFQYRVKKDDNGDSIFIPKNALKLPKPKSDRQKEPTITDLSGENVDRTYHKIEGGKTRTVDMPPIGKTVEIISTLIDSARSYGVGEEIWLLVTFSEDVTLTGTPQLKLDIGGNTRMTTMAQHYNKNSRVGGPDVNKKVLFVYQVQENDQDTDGISLKGEGDTRRGALFYNIHYPEEGASINDKDGTPHKATEITNTKRIHFPEYKVNVPVQKGD